MSDGIFITPPKNTNFTYYTVGAATVPGKPRAFVIRQDHVWVFRSYESAAKYRDIYANGLAINGWVSLIELATQVQERHNEIPLISLEPKVDAGAERQSVSVDDILKVGSEIE